ncbi:MAG: hypothetical protein R3C03_22450 [Pirellulaceae bacterium]
MSENANPAGAMFKSFLVVAGSAFAIVFGDKLALAVIAYTFYPQVFKAFTTTELTQEQLANDPTILPVSLLWATLGVMTLVSLLLGYLVSKVTNAAQNHAVFLAIVVFVIYLQTLFAAPIHKWLIMIAMFVFPAAVLVGAKLGRKRDGSSLMLE